MKIIRCKKDPYGESINFVDQNGVFVGYDVSPHYAEHFYFYFSPPMLESELEPYVFDPSSCHVSEVCKKIKDSYQANNRYAVMFRLVTTVKSESEAVYLTLVNCHSGYYSHGFEMKDADGKTLHEGSI